MDLLWVDLETTGLEPREHTILEVHMARASLEHPFETTELFNGVIHFDLDAAKFVIDGDPVPYRSLIHPTVIEMHEKNGLWAACKEAKTSLVEVEDLLCELVPEVENREDKPVLAGNSVHFDLSFLRAHMPKFAKRLSHRVYDVSAVSLFARSLGMPKLPKDEAHRAKADVLASIRQASACANYLINVNAGP